MSPRANPRPMRDRLYLLKPNFGDKGTGPFFCAECAVVEGMLSFYPQLRKELDVRYIAFERPRPELVHELGPDHQSSPTLVLADGPTANLPATVHVQTANGKRFIQNEYEICNYLAARHKLGAPHK